MWNIQTNHLCIAISGLSGCGNTSVSSALAKMLGIPCINYTLRNLAQDEGIAFAEMRMLAEQDDTWDLLLDEKQIAFSKHQSCVVGSRLAIWKIPYPSLKVYLEVDERIRATRIQKREQGDIALIQKKTNDRDMDDYKRYKRLYTIDVKQYKTQADIIINANTLGIAEVVDYIMKALIQNNSIKNL